MASMVLPVPIGLASHYAAQDTADATALSIETSASTRRAEGDLFRGVDFCIHRFAIALTNPCQPAGD
jgi:hypothetical protein